MSEATTNGNGKTRRIYNLEHQVEGMSDNESVGVVVEAIRDMARERMDADILIRDLRSEIAELNKALSGLYVQRDSMTNDLITAQEERDVAVREADAARHAATEANNLRYRVLGKLNSLNHALDRMRARWVKWAQERKLTEAVCALDLAETLLRDAPDLFLSGSEAATHESTRKP